MTNVPFSVLIVDDSEDVRLLLGRLMTSYGFKISTAASGNEAYDRLQMEVADLVITDIMMPEGRGDDLVKKLRAAGNLVPVFLISAGADFSAESARKIGADGFFQKPAEIIDLPDAVEAFLAGRTK